MQEEKLKKTYKKVLISISVIIYICFFGFITYKYITENRYWEIDSLPFELNSERGKEISVFAVVKNKMYYALGSDEGYFISYHVYDERGKMIQFENPRTIIDNIKPGDAKTVEIKIKAPEEKGRYIVEIDIVKENEYWFASRGDKTGIMYLTVN